MIPGSVSRFSEQSVAIAANGSIVQKSDICRISSTASTTVLVNIIPFLPSQGGILWVLNSSGAAITATTAGNIATTVSIPNGNICMFVFTKITQKWHADKTT